METNELRKRIRKLIKLGDLDGVEEIFSAHPEAIVMDTTFGSWLHVASSFGQLSIVQRLVELGVDINHKRGIAGGGALHRAAADGHLEVVQYLIECGADLDTSQSQSNPLFGAIINGHLEIGKYLVAKGIDWKFRYSGDLDALGFAQQQGALEFVTFLESLHAAEGSGGTLCTNLSMAQVKANPDDSLSDLIFNAVVLAFAEWRESHPREQVFAFALSTIDTPKYVNASVNSEESHERTVARLKCNPDSDNMSVVKWGPWEWEYEFIGQRHFSVVTERLKSLYEKMRKDEFPQFCELVEEAMLNALLRIREALVVTNNGELSGITFFATIYDSAGASELERKSARLLNPEECASEFLSVVGDS